MASAVVLGAAAGAAAGALAVLTYQMVRKEIRNRRVRRESNDQHFRIIILDNATKKTLKEIVASKLDPEMLRLFPNDGDWLVT